jgi:hypothetical protein
LHGFFIAAEMHAYVAEDSECTDCSVGHELYATPNLWWILGGEGWSGGVM